MSNVYGKVEPMNSKHGRRLAASFLGVLATIAIFEIALRIIGIVELDKGRPTEAGKDGKPVVVFAGNSHTLGSGAPVGRSFPDQFRELLAEMFGETPFQIVNVGRGNANSTFVADAMPGFLEKYQPKYLVLMTGETNYWNHFGYGRYYQIQHGWNLFTAAYDLAYRSRTFRFVQLFFEFIIDPRRRDPANVFSDLSTIDRAYMWIAVTNNSNMYSPGKMSEDELRSAYAALHALHSTLPQHIGVVETLMDVALALGHYDAKYREYGFSYARKLTELTAGKYSYSADRMLNVYLKGGEFGPETVRLSKDLIDRRPQPFKLYEEFYSNFSPPQAIDALPAEKKFEFLKKALSHHPNQPQVRFHYFQKLIDSNQTEEAIRVIQEGIDLNPFANHFNWISLLRNTGEGLKWKKNPDAEKFVVETEKIAAEYKKRFPSQEGRTRVIKNTEIENWVRADLQRIFEETERRGVKLMLQTYPPERYGPEKLVDQIIRNFARERGLPLSDTSNHFLTLQPDSIKRKEFFTKMYGDHDNHLGESGYAEIAKILVPAFERAGWLPAK